MSSNPFPIINNTCAIFVSHNPDEGFIENVKSAGAQVDAVVVVNNGSPKITPEFIAQAELKKTHIISNQHSLGQGKALNQGVSWATNQGYQWFLLMDQDGRPAPSMLAQIFETYEKYPEKEKVAMIAANTILRIINKRQYVKECVGDNLFFERTVVMLTGTLLPKTTYEKAGPFREEFFIDSTDADYSLRVRKYGLRIIVSCKAAMLHGIGNEPRFKTFLGKQLLVTNHPPGRCYFMARNGLTLVKEYFFREPWWCLKRIAWYFIYKPGLIMFYEKNKARKLIGMLTGTLDALKGSIKPRYSV